MLWTRWSSKPPFRQVAFILFSLFFKIMENTVITVVRQGIESIPPPKQQRWPLPSLLSLWLYPSSMLGILCSVSCVTTESTLGKYSLSTARALFLLLGPCSTCSPCTLSLFICLLCLAVLRTCLSLLLHGNSLCTCCT